MTSTCFFCSSALSTPSPDGPGAGERFAFDPWKGRLWTVCGACHRWNPVPLEDRWETVEGLEAATASRGRIRLSSDDLSLVKVGSGDLVRVGSPPRVALAGWRYGSRIPAPGRGSRFVRRFVHRFLSTLPDPPVGGYNPYGSLQAGIPPAEWMRSPFMEQAVPLTFAFAQIPFAQACPACAIPMPLEPWRFGDVAFVDSREGEVRADCGSCGTQVVLSIQEARPSLRLGLGLVTRGDRLTAFAEPGGESLERAGGPHGLLRTLGRDGADLGGLDPVARAALVISLDELAELEALEREWREAEEVAAIMDGELTHVPGFEAFRRRVLGLD